MLIPNWRRAWRMFSVQLAAALVVWAATPAETQAAVLQVVGIGPDQLAGVLGILIILGRLIDQPATRE
jgi:hypothetical protein